MLWIRRVDRDLAARHANSRWIEKLALGERLIAAQVGGCELAVHRQEGRTAEHLVDLSSMPVGTVWLLERCACGGAVAPLEGDWIQAPVHRCAPVRGLRLSDHRVICGLLPPGVVAAEAVVGGEGGTPVHLGPGVFLLVAPRARDIVLRLHGVASDLVREYPIPSRYDPRLAARASAWLQPGIGPPPPDEPSAWIFTWTT
ncbi:MAG: hypothetical protein M3Q29_03205 [Chloroflexota bacterium]|nr:hypothetical protein [Chloroflexota bacterium]